MVKVHAQSWLLMLAVLDLGFLVARSLLYLSYPSCIHQIIGGRGEAGECIVTFTDLKNAYNSVRRKVFCNYLSVFAIHIKILRLIKMNLNETYSKA
jgi:hypothetical protein